MVYVHSMGHYVPWYTLCDILWGRVHSMAYTMVHHKNPLGLPCSLQGGICHEAVHQPISPGKQVRKPADETNVGIGGRYLCVRDSS